MKIATIIQPSTKLRKHIFYKKDLFGPILSEPEADPNKTLLSGRTMAKAWAKILQPDIHLETAQAFLKTVLSSYWQAVHKVPLKLRPLPKMYVHIPQIEMDDSVVAVAEEIGKAAAKMNVITAAYELGNLYTGVLPEGMRSTNGVFYTPPALTHHLINMVDSAGVNWATASVADPACGGGAFLAPVALEILKAVRDKPAGKQIEHIENHLKGYEIDPFAAWLTQIFLEVALKDVIIKAARPVKQLVTVCNTLEYNFASKEKFDLVIGNPPYGKIKLTEGIRLKYKNSLYGHPNLYGLFTHLAIDIVKAGGIIGYLTPTSFLSGEYFKKLRSFIRKETMPLSIDFVAVRKGVFEDVLQETTLATYRKKNGNTIVRSPITVNEIITLPGEMVQLNTIESYTLPKEPSAPWILPKEPSQASIVEAMSGMTMRLKDWGYKISTGQLVWNRYKEQLTNRYNKKCFPVVWAEAVMQDGNFLLRAEKKNHSTWFRFEEGDDYLLTTEPCLLLQRTTSKEQDKRLITAVLPQNVLDQKKAVIVENHLNMIIPMGSVLAVNLEVLSIFLNSKAVNDAFRTISGSVAVSAYELESLPLPDTSNMVRLKKLIQQKASQALIEQECLKLYTK